MELIIIHILAQNGQGWFLLFREKASAGRSIILKTHISEPNLKMNLSGFAGNSGIGVISDTDPQPILFNSHLGKFAIVTVSRLVNISQLEERFLKRQNHFTENFEGNINPTEVVANLICEKESFVEGIENVFENIKGSCSLLILTENGIIAARDKLAEHRL